MSPRRASDSPPRPPRPKAPPADGPDVIVDFVFEDGLFYVCVRNVSPRPAAHVSVRFQRKFRGLGGQVSIPDLPLFRHIEFLAPQKEIRTLLDTSDAYFSRGEPPKLTAWITFQDLEGHLFRRTVKHDLSIYQGVTYLVPNATEAGRRPGPGPTRD